MNLKARIAKLEKIAIPQKRIVVYADMERAHRVLYLFNLAHLRAKETPGIMRIVDLIGIAVARRKQIRCNEN